MADADEDTIPRLGASTEDTDLTEETQDFRFLATLSCVAMLNGKSSELIISQTRRCQSPEARREGLRAACNSVAIKHLVSIKTGYAQRIVFPAGASTAQPQRC